MSAERFEKEKESIIGPGSYEIPTALDDHAPLIASCAERLQDGMLGGEQSTGSLKFYEDMLPPAPDSARRKSVRSTSRTPFGNSKENRGPSAGEKSATKAKDKKVEELQKKMDELSALHKEAMRRACELETEKGARNKALVEKEQQVAALQKTLGTTKALLEERGKRVEEMGTQVAATTAEAEQLRKQAAGLREHLQAIALEEKHFEETSGELASVREAAAEQARELEAALDEVGAAKAAVIERALTCFDGLGERLFGQAEEAEAGLRHLAEEHERLRQIAAERVEELQERAAKLEAALRKGRKTEAELASIVSVREASLAAALEVREKSCATHAEELRLARQEEREEVERRLGGQLAEMRGRLYTAESARDLSSASQKELERQLAATTEAEHLEVARLQAALEASEAARQEEQEARDELERQLEEDKAACHQAQLQVESLSAEAEALRTSWHKDEARARAREEELEEALRTETQRRQSEAAAAEEERRRLAEQAQRAEADVAAPLERSCE
eukprot:CAMPEP_0195120900 /NCGR_PEP_ID=MMETSP0448-20130528/122944_1 /TAXON_ID=66468 /ORGANISM="Heterocapsa triquestra, Strain CCMP 448" /LENGTH=510 /DNA_ID=CAMNT_0040158353 /DNA_START=43 /DNA_END=1572 /DNA_ORIENTATION=-